MVAFYGDGEDELNLAFNFPFVYSPFDSSLAEVVAETERLLPAGVMAGLDRVEPRCRPLPHALVRRRRRRTRGSPCSSCSRCGVRRSSTTATSSG